MAKFAIFASLLFFAYGVNAWSLLSGIEETIQSYAEQVINVTETIEASVNEALAKVEAYINDLESAEEEILSEFFDSVDASYAAIEEQIKEYESETTACWTLLETLNETRNEIIANVSSCTSTVVAKGKVSFEEAKTMAEEIISKVTAYSEEYEACVADLDDIASQIQGMVCAAAVFAKLETYSVITFVEALEELGSLGVDIFELTAQLSACDATAMANSFAEEASATGESANTCISEASAAVAA